MYLGSMLGSRIIEKMKNNDICWKINQITLEDFPEKENAIDILLNLFELPSLFETSKGFNKVDGEKTIFMLDRIFEIKLLDNTWSIYCDKIFYSLKSECEKVIFDVEMDIWTKLKKINTILSIPDDYPYQIVMGYSLARFIENLPNMKISSTEPEFLLRVYRYNIVYRNSLKNVEINELSLESLSSSIRSLLKKIKNFEKKEYLQEDYGHTVLRTPEKYFINSVMKAKDYIKSGDIYQVQLCREEISTSQLTPISIFKLLRKINPSPYMAFIDLENTKLISSSPEAMLRIENNNLMVRPIAGTIKSNTSKNNLIGNPKENAEHLMLVDLARNDLAKSNKEYYCDVNVKSLMKVENYGHLTHLVSTIETKLDFGYDFWDVIKRNFPSGTMVGAPKVRAMEIISEMELYDRGIFTGACGYFSGKEAILSLIIRSIVGDVGRYYLRAAAGIVYDSEPIDEWNEAGEKIKSFSNIFTRSNHNEGSYN